MATTSTRARSTTTHRAPRKGRTVADVQSGAAQHANGENLKQMGEEEKKAPNPTTAVIPEPANADERFLIRVQHPVLVQSIQTAAASFKTAINLEVAVCLAVFASKSDSGINAKKELYGIYKEAGYDCNAGGDGVDYKTVNRRINYAAKFYDSLVADDEDAVRRLMGNAQDHAALQGIVSHLSAEYNFRGMNDVLRAAGEEPPAPKRQEAAAPAPAAQAPAAGTPAPAPGQGSADDLIKRGQEIIDQGKQGTEPNHDDRGVLAEMSAAGEARAQAQAPVQNRRAFDDKSKWVKIEHQGIVLIVPTDCPPGLLQDFCMEVMKASVQMHKGDRIDAEVLRAIYPHEEATNH